MSNYLKKPEQLNDVYILVGGENKGAIRRNTHIFINKIVPNRVIKDRNVYMITHLDEMFYLNGFEISTENNKVMNVRVFGIHPNCDTNTDTFCLPDFKKGVDFNSDYLSLIKTNIETYYLDNCFFNPTGIHLRYKKMKSIFVQLNK